MGNLLQARRSFLRSISAAAFWATHGLARAEQPAPPAATTLQKLETPVVATREPLLRALELLSAAPLTAMRAFYHEQLGLPIVTHSAERLTIAAGQTRLTFLAAAADAAEPFYHFAFNIPENKIHSAWQWQRERTSLLPIPARLRDARYPDEVVHYRHWNAHSVFFFDPAGNVVEYIARHDLANAAPGDFGSSDILYASEIAFVADDVRALARTLSDVAEVKPYRGGSDEFMALGSEWGLLLVMQRGRVISFDSPIKKAVSVFRTQATLRGTSQRQHQEAALPYHLQVEP